MSLSTRNITSSDRVWNASVVRRKRQLHFAHHLHASSNFAVIDFFWDRMLGTYRKPDQDIC